MLKTLTLRRDVYGYGFTLSKEQPCTVEFVMPCSAANNSGLACGDVLVEVNGINSEQLSHEEISSLIWSSSVVTLKFISHHDPRNESANFSNIPASLQQPCDSNSPLFTGHTVVSQHLRTSVVQYVDKLTVDSKLGLKSHYIVSRLYPLRQKALDNNDYKVEAICLFEVFTDYLRIHLPSKIFEYSANDLGFVGALEDDKRFFYLFTRGRRKLSKVNDPLNPDHATAAPSSCCLFRCLPHKYLGHRGHADIIKQFNITCHRDRLSGECSEFPRSVHPLVEDLSTLISQTGHFTSPLCTPKYQVDRSRPSTTSKYSVHSRSARMPRTFQNACGRTKRLESVSVMTPITVSRLSSSRLFGKLSQAAAFFRGRLRRTSVVPESEQPPTPLGEHNTNQHSLSIPSESSSSSDNQIPQSSPRDSLSGRSCDTYRLSKENLADFLTSRVTPTSRQRRASARYRVFDDILYCPMGLKCFHAFLSSEYSSENLEFWCAVQNWRERFPSENSSKDARIIFSTFLDPESPRAVNVNEVAVRQAERLLPVMSPDTFSEATNQVYHLMRLDSFPRFLHSTHYNTLLSSESNSGCSRANSPSASCAPLRRPTRSPSVYVQRSNSVYDALSPKQRLSAGRRQSLNFPLQSPSTSHDRYRYTPW